MSHSLVLGSASPRRAQLLRELGVAFVVRASDIPEVPAPGEAAAEFARRAAREKALAVAALSAGRWVLGADTIVVVDGAILGKPTDAADACRMLGLLSGRRHQVMTGLALVGPDGALREDLVVDSGVTFRHLERDEIEGYVRTGEPLDKAGAYAIQGGAAPFVQEVSGSYSNIVGLPLDEVADLLRRHGVAGARR